MSETLVSLNEPSLERVDLLALTRDQLAEHLEAWGVGARQANRVFRHLHALDVPLEQIPNLGRHARTISERSYMSEVSLERHTTAPDGTIKLLFRLADGGRVESVLLPMRRERYTLCLSTQVGCAMACTFCATGTLGLKRSLTPGEVVAQVLGARRFVESLTGEQGEREVSQRELKQEPKRELSHLVFMGMGEPLHSYERTRDALRVLMDPHGKPFSSRKITVSTVGLTPAMKRFSEDFQGRVQLALSLHAGTDATRQKIIPTARKWGLESLKEALLAHPLPNNRVLMLEYVVLPGVNDSEEELNGVAEFARGLRALVNLIPFNPFPNAPFRSPTLEEVKRVEEGLKARRVPCSVRVTRGQERAGACGQLAIQGFEV